MSPNKTDQTVDQALIDDCISHLENEKTVLLRFLQLSEQLQNDLISDVSPDVEKVKAAEQQLVDDSERISTNRTSLRNRIASNLQVTEQQASIRLLSEHVAEPYSKTLGQLRAELLEIRQSIDNLNRSNSILLQHSIDLYQKIIGGVLGNGSSSATYDKTGNVRQGMNGNLLRTDC